MKALLWKDWHVSRPVLLAAVGLAAVPYLILFLANFIVQVRFHTSEPWYAVLADACKGSMILGVVSISLLGGYVLAGERSERSAEFLAYLPVARGRILASKLALVIAALLALWLIEGLLALLAMSAMPDRPTPGYQTDFLVWLAICILSLGAAWLIGALVGSPAIGTAAGLAAPVLLLLCLALPGVVMNWKGEFPARLYVMLAAALGLGLLAAGSGLFVRRVEG